MFRNVPRKISNFMDHFYTFILAPKVEDVKDFILKEEIEPNQGDKRYKFVDLICFIRGTVLNLCVVTFDLIDDLLRNFLSFVHDCSNHF